MSGVSKTFKHDDVCNLRPFHKIQLKNSRKWSIHNFNNDQYKNGLKLLFSYNESSGYENDKIFIMGKFTHLRNLNFE